ncbi:hypothetical protein BZM26_29615 [Paraburkholderia strydomiana]|nr:hypothetical protein BZM26_29615 [Paraburkholderia strydomiana]
MDANAGWKVSLVEARHLGNAWRSLRRSREAGSWLLVRVTRSGTIGLEVTVNRPTQAHLPVQGDSLKRNPMK